MDHKINKQAYFIVCQSLTYEMRKTICFVPQQDSTNSEKLSQSIPTHNFFPLKTIEKFPLLKGYQHVLFQPICSNQLQQIIRISENIGIQSQQWSISEQLIESWSAIMSHISQTHCKHIQWFQNNDNEKFTVSIQKSISEIKFCELRQLQLLNCMIANTEIITFLDAPQIQKIIIEECPFIWGLKPFAKTNFPNLKNIIVNSDQISDSGRNFSPLSRAKADGDLFYMCTVYNFYCNRKSAFQLTDWRFLLKLQYIDCSEIKKVQSKQTMTTRGVFQKLRDIIHDEVSNFRKRNQFVERKGQNQLIKHSVPSSSHMSEHILNKLFNKSKLWQKEAFKI